MLIGLTDMGTREISPETGWPGMCRWVNYHSASSTGTWRLKTYAALLWDLANLADLAETGLVLTHPASQFEFDSFQVGCKFLIKGSDYFQDNQNFD